METKTTAGTGTCKFENLEVGIYVLMEITAPDQITTPLAEDSLISIPMVNTATSGNNDNAEWIYDIYVYPKNHESTGTLELTKVDQNGSPLKDVVFELYKKEFLSNGELTTEDWKAVTATTANDGTATTLTLQTNSDGKITLANLPANLYGTQYKLVEVSAPNGYIVNQTPLYFKVNNNNTITWNEASGDANGCNNTNTGVVGTPTISAAPKLTIALRNELPSLNKEVQENGGNTWKTDEQYRLDDAITYRLTVYVPQNVTEFDRFEIKDIPGVGITDYSNSVTVKYTVDENNEQSLTGDQFSVTEIPAVTGTNGKGFNLTLTDVGKTAVAGKFIQIEYKAHMNANAVIAGNGNGNKATLTYSKYIGGGEGTYAITDEARVYTYQYQITKRKDSATGEVAEGVEFNLLYKADGTAIDVFKEADGVYRLWLASDVDTSKKTTTLTTKADGTILIQGLENGIYYLKETKTINGYNLLSQPFEITVGVYEVTSWTSDTGYAAAGRTVKSYQSTTYYKDPGKSEKFVNTEGSDDTSAIVNSNVINKKGFVLPQTGSMGYLLFCTVGIVLIGGGAALIFGGRKKKIR